MIYTPPIGGAANDPYIDANPGGGIDGSILPAQAVEDPQREIVAVIVAAGLTPTAATLNQLLTAIQSFQQVATGIIVAGGAAAAPAGYLLCNGAAVSRTTFSALFTAIGTTWGVGDGATTFNVPDLRGKAIIGAGQGAGLTNRVLGTTGGEETHVLIEGEMPAHVHAYRISGPGGTTAALNGTDPGSGGVNTLSTGGNAAHNNMQPYAVCTPLIKT